MKNNWSTFRQNQQNCPVPINIDCLETSIFKVYLGGLIWGTAVIDKNDNVYVGSTNKRFFCISPDGSVKWKYKIKNVNDSLIDSAAAIYNNSHVIVPGGDGYLHTLDINTGEPIHVTDEIKDNNLHSTGIVVNSFEGNVQIDDNGLIYAGCDNDYIYCMKSIGNILWKYKTNLMIWTCAAVNDGICYFGSLDYYIYAVNKYTGKLIKKYNSGSEIKSSPLIYNSYLYFGNTNGEVFCFSKGLGQLIWQRDIGRNIYSSPVVYENSIIFCCLNGDVFCLRVDNGDIIWKVSLITNICSSPIIVNSALIVANNLCKLIALNVTNGRILGAIELNKKDIKRSINASLSINSKGQIIFGSYDGCLYFVPCNFYLKYNNIALETIAEISSHKKIYLELNKSKNHIITFKFIVIDHQNASISPGTLKITPQIPYTSEVSADGTFINLIPDNWDYLDKEFEINISGEYFIQTESWIQDRFKFNSGSFNQTVRFTTAKTREFVKLPKEIDISGMYVEQPAILDTYIPAALDAQGARIIFTKDHAVLFLCIPDIEDEFIPSDDASKYFKLNYKIYKNIIILDGSFELSAMGGTIPLRKFKMFLELEGGDMVKGCLWGLSNCLSIKGNGKSYKFSSNIVNQLCDRFLQLQTIATFVGKIKK
jgi:outer membrane protein assembly factor BamB